MPASDSESQEAGVSIAAGLRGSPHPAGQSRQTGNSSPPCVASSPCGVCIVARCPFSAGEEREPRAASAKFPPPSCQPPLLLSWRSWVGTQSPTLVERKQLADVLRIKALWRLHCCALAVAAVGEQEHRPSDRVAVALSLPIERARSWHFAAARRRLVGFRTNGGCRHGLPTRQSDRLILKGRAPRPSSV